jgi:Ca-activated chloride channel family protein
MVLRHGILLYLSMTVAFAAAGAVAPAEARAELYRGLMQRGLRYYRKELYRDAAENFGRAAARNEKALEPSFNSAAAYYKNSQYQKSIESLQRARRKADDPDHLADISYNLGNAFFKLGDYQSAIDVYMEGLSHDPHDLNMKYNLELAQRRREEQRRAADQESPPVGSAASEGAQERQPGDEEERPTDQTVDTDAGEGAQRADQERDFSEEEARLLIDSINNRETTTIGDIIRRRMGETDDESDW